MDALSNVLRAIRLSAAVFFDVRASKPVIAQTPDMSSVGQMVIPGSRHVIPFHIMLRGSCWIEDIDGQEPPVEFHEGDVVVYPQGHGHILVTNPGDRLPQGSALSFPHGARSLPVGLSQGDSGVPELRILYGFLSCDSDPVNPLCNALPSRVLARRPREGSHVELDLVHAALAETEANRAGNETILARLSELLFVRVLRRYLEQLPENSEGWLASLCDPNLGRALYLIHDKPARDWTLDELARQSGMSRAVFADRFTKQIGETPMRYLTKWRMQIAATALTRPEATIESVAIAVGYQSEAAFNRAFKNIVGVPPGAWRRARNAALEAS